MKTMGLQKQLNISQSKGCILLCLSILILVWVILDSTKDYDGILLFARKDITTRIRMHILNSDVDSIRLYGSQSQNLYQSSIVPRIDSNVVINGYSWHSHLQGLENSETFNSAAINSHSNGNNNLEQTFGNSLEILERRGKHLSAKEILNMGEFQTVLRTLSKSSKVKSRILQPSLHELNFSIAGHPESTYAQILLF